MTSPYAMTHDVTINDKGFPDIAHAVETAGGTIILRPEHIKNLASKLMSDIGGVMEFRKVNGTYKGVFVVTDKDTVCFVMLATSGWEKWSASTIPAFRWVDDWVVTFPEDTTVVGMGAANINGSADVISYGEVTIDEETISIQTGEFPTFNEILGD